MKASELRIGNLVKSMSGNELKIQSVNSEYCECKSMNNRFTANRRTDLLKPIPLTEEWLVKFGFTVINHKGMNGFIDSGFEFLYNIESKQMYSFSEVDGSVWNLTRCKHVHQLQNLYFALTGEELTIK